MPTKKTLFANFLSLSFNIKYPITPPIIGKNPPIIPKGPPIIPTRIGNKYQSLLDFFLIFDLLAMINLSFHRIKIYLIQDDVEVFLFLYNFLLNKTV